VVIYKEFHKTSQTVLYCGRTSHIGLDCVYIYVLSINIRFQVGNAAVTGTVF